VVRARATSKQARKLGTYSHADGNDESDGWPDDFAVAGVLISGELLKNARGRARRLAVRSALETDYGDGNAVHVDLMGVEGGFRDRDREWFLETAVEDASKTC
jgi:hypothetical protein